jgi:hypothetical protein
MKTKILKTLRKEGNMGEKGEEKTKQNTEAKRAFS